MLSSLLILLFFLSLPFSSLADEQVSSAPGILRKWAAPFYSEQSRTLLFSGLGLSALLYADRTNIGDPLQESWSESEPMGDLATFGDIMGQLVPNLTYIVGAHFSGYKENRNLMFDATLYTGISVIMLKHLVGEERPNGGDNLSFPSGHTATAFAFAGVVGIEHKWYWALPAYSIAVIVGASRINDHAHYLHDVVFGAALGLSYAYGLSAIYEEQGKMEASAISLLPINDGLYLAYNLRF